MDKGTESGASGGGASGAQRTMVAAPRRGGDGRLWCGTRYTPARLGAVRRFTVPLLAVFALLFVLLAPCFIRGAPML